MTTTERLLNVSKEIWEAYHEHPFVKGIADGSLDKEKIQILYDTGLSVSDRLYERYLPWEQPRQKTYLP